MAVLGNIGATLEAIAEALGSRTTTDAASARATIAELEAKYPASGKRPSDALIVRLLRHLDLATHIITEGSSEDATRTSDCEATRIRRPGGGTILAAAEG